jgi:CubicO group peptidase (beta-lactamase class C family)
MFAGLIIKKFSFKIVFKSGVAVNSKIIFRRTNLIWVLILYFIILVYSCKNPDQVNYQPIIRGDWPVSTPEAEGLDPAEVENLYHRAEEVEHLYSILIIKNGYLIAEKYFNGQDINDANPIASVTKSFISALSGIALRENILPSRDDKMKNFFSELDWKNMDARKSQITIRQMLQMRAGYPWEENYPEYIDLLVSRQDWVPLLQEFPLTNNPGTKWGYSNLTTIMMATILERSLAEPFSDFAQRLLFGPLSIIPKYINYNSLVLSLRNGEPGFTPRDLAKFGQLYLNGGTFNNIQILPQSWTEESLITYSHDIFDGDINNYITNIGFGYLWWSAEAGAHKINFASGSGGQLIIIVQELKLVIVATADNLFLQFDSDAAQKQMKVWNLVGRFLVNI